MQHIYYPYHLVHNLCTYIMTSTETPPLEGFSAPVPYGSVLPNDRESDVSTFEATLP